jgi:putative transposase
MAQARKDPLINNQIYHVYNRSIAGFKFFNTEDDYERMVRMIDLYRYNDFDYRFSRFDELDSDTKEKIISVLRENSSRSVEIIAYCLMPTHLHLVLKQLSESGISKYLSKLLNSYARYFNQKYKRSGHLWSGTFKSVLVEDDEQLLHLTRYIHLNPTSSKLAETPEDWAYSSYEEYLHPDKASCNICHFDGLFDLKSDEYKRFVDDRKEYQAKLSEIKSILIDDYTG